MQALDKKISFTMFIKSIGNKLQSIMAKSISPEEKLQLIQDEMEKDTQSKRVIARNIRAKMVALKDPDTENFEPIERLQARRKKLVNIGAKVMKEDPNSVQVSKIAKEIKSLDASVSSLEMTYQTLSESYDIALENYKVALSAFEHVKNNGSALLFAIKAHQDALKTRDLARNDSKKVDASFLTDLENTLAQSQQELRSDENIDKEIVSHEESTLDLQEDSEIENKIIDEFKKI